MEGEERGRRAGTAGGAPRRPRPANLTQTKVQRSKRPHSLRNASSGMPATTLLRLASSRHQAVDV